MTRRRTVVLAFTTAVLTLWTACSDGSSPVSPNSNPGPVRGAPGSPPGLGALLSRRAEHSRLSAAIPGYAGMYYDASGNVHVNVAQQSSTGSAGSLSDVATASDAIRTQIRAALEAQAGSKLTVPELGPVLVHNVSFTILALDDMDDQARSLLTMPGVVFVGELEDSNRVAIGIDRTSSDVAGLKSRVLGQLQQLGVPAAAVSIVLVSPVQPMVTLRDRVRPVFGGLQISFPALPPNPPGSFFICTLGFNAKSPASATPRFVTASHCTETQGGVENTHYYQPTPVDSNLIAREVLDPTYGSAGGFCPTGRRCRFSDASMAEYAPGVSAAVGALARTTFSLDRIGSLELDPTGPLFTVLAEAPFPRLGQTMSKVGRTTGWTTGTVEFTCVDLNVANSDVTLICQDIVQAGVGPGDSGSPVFAQLTSGGTTAVLYGVLWGGTSLIFTDGTTIPAFVFSDMENIHLELGAFSVTPPTTTP